MKVERNSWIQKVLKSSSQTWKLWGQGVEDEGEGEVLMTPSHLAHFLR
jgi:hypothetical protein